MARRPAIGRRGADRCQLKIGLDQGFVRRGRVTGIEPASISLGTGQSLAATLDELVDDVGQLASEVPIRPVCVARLWPAGLKLVRPTDPAGGRVRVLADEDVDRSAFPELDYRPVITSLDPETWSPRPTIQVMSSLRS